MKPERFEGLLPELMEIIHQNTGITLDRTLPVRLERKINKRLEKLEIDSVEKYLKLLKTDKKELGLFIDQITTHETYFYRTSRIWEYISEKVIPVKKNIRAWSAAASSGEEAYTLAMLCEYHRVRHPEFSYSILGTDVSEGVINQARAGCYETRSVSRLELARPDLLHRYLRKSASGYSVSAEIKKHVSFEVGNLFNLPHWKEKFSLVLLRNVLIYFNRQDQMQVVANVYENTDEGGILIIGEAESIKNIESGFNYRAPFVYER